MAKQTTLNLGEPRIRFNSGFWDGFAGAWKGRSIRNHFDEVYAAGVVAGEDTARTGEQPNTSDAAWKVCDFSR